MVGALEYWRDTGEVGVKLTEEGPQPGATLLGTYPAIEFCGQTLQDTFQNLFCWASFNHNGVNTGDTAVYKVEGKVQEAWVAAPEHFWSGGKKQVDLRDVPGYKILRLFKENKK